MTWIHFTNDLNFELNKDSLEADEVSKVFKGIFVYKYHKDFPVEQAKREWGGREAVLIDCDEQYVELIQTDPLDDNSDNDEYLIPYEHFDKCSWWWY